MGAARGIAMAGLSRERAALVAFMSRRFIVIDPSERRVSRFFGYTWMRMFEKVHSFEDFDKEKASAYLKIFEIEDKVEMEEKGFSSIDLSTGQRKRLALIAALLEERPILVLDEWAADQDPHFRKRFYTEIIPMLKAEGRTILAITHDDAYYHCADELYRMEYGKLVRQQELQLGQPVLD